MQRPRGYRALAALMGSYADIAQLRRVSKFNSHSLLIQQAELLHLERKFQSYAIVDRNRGLDYDTDIGNLILAGRRGVMGEQ